MSILNIHRKMLIRGGFILKSGRRSQISQKNAVRDFQNSPPFKRCTYFDETMTGDVKRFH